MRRGTENLVSGWDSSLSQGRHRPKSQVVLSVKEYSSLLLGRERYWKNTGTCVTDVKKAVIAKLSAKKIEELGLRLELHSRFFCSQENSEPSS